MPCIVVTFLAMRAHVSTVTAGQLHASRSLKMLVCLLFLSLLMCFVEGDVDGVLEGKNVYSL